SRFVKNAIDAGHCGSHSTGIPNVALDDFQIGISCGESQIVALARGKIVEHARFVVALKQVLHDVRPDKASSPSDKEFHLNYGPAYLGPPRHEVGLQFFQQKGDIA